MPRRDPTTARGVMHRGYRGVAPECVRGHTRIMTTSAEDRTLILLRHAKSSWDDPVMQEILHCPQVHRVTSDQCMYGLVTHDAQGNLVAAKTPTSWATSSVQTARRLSTRSSGDHAHQHLLGEEPALPPITPSLSSLRSCAASETRLMLLNLHLISIPVVLCPENLINPLLVDMISNQMCFRWSPRRSSRTITRAGPAF